VLSSVATSFFTALLIQIVVGINEGWPSVYGPVLLESFNITTSEEAWIVQAMNIGELLGCLVSLPAVDRFGRKISMLGASLPYLLAPTLLAYATSTPLFCLARLISGLAMGISNTTIFSYLGEISHPTIRGKLTMCLYILNLLGIVLINVVGSSFNIRNSSFSTVGIVLVFVLTFVWMPESPYFDVMKKNFDRARKSLVKLRGHPDVDEDLDQIKETVKIQTEHEGKFKDLFVVKSNRRALVVAFIVLSSKHLIVDGIIDAYGQTIFQILVPNVSPTLVIVVYYTLEIFTAFFASCLVDKLGRRPMILVALFASGLAILTVGTYLYLKLHTSTDLRYMNTVPATAIGIFAIFYSFLYSIPATLLSELFPMNVKTFASSLATLYFSTISIINITFYQVTTCNFGMDVPFLTLGVSFFVHFVLVYIFVFETKGKSLGDIQRHLETVTTESTAICITYNEA
jgi:MFS family permease